jgi:hypothetical protein
MASGILRGTTPTLYIEIDKADLLLSDVTELELTFKQNNKPPVIKHLQDCDLDMDSNIISYHFTERETIKLSASYAFNWQLRAVTLDGQVVGTEIQSISISELMSREVLTE